MSNEKDPSTPAPHPPDAPAPKLDSGLGPLLWFAATLAAIIALGYFTR